MGGVHSFQLRSPELLAAVIIVFFDTFSPADLHTHSNEAKRE